MYLVVVHASKCQSVRSDTFSFLFVLHSVCGLKSLCYVLGPKTKEGCKIHCEQMAQILALDVRAINDYHTYPGAQMRTYTSKDDYVAKFGAVLAKTGENDVTGKKMFEVMQKASSSKCVIL